MNETHRIARLALGLALFALASLASSQEPPDGADLIGTWSAEPEHNGQVGGFVIRFEADGEAGFRAVFSLPPLDAWDIATVPATPYADRVEIGPWVLTREPDGGLSGVLPASMVPVHRIPFTLRRTDPIEPATPAPIDAPVAEPVWSRDLGSPIWAGLSVDRGLLYVGDDSGRLSALEAGTGRTRWELTTGRAIRSRPVATPAALLVHSDDGFLYALDPGSGDLVWRAKVASEEFTRLPIGAEGARYNHYASSAVLADGTVYTGGFDGQIYALDATSGKERWRFAAGDTVAGTPAVVDGRLFFGSFDGHIYALDASTGKEIWRYETGGAVVSSPLVHQGRVIVGSRSYDLLALDAETGAVEWKYYYWFSWVESSAVERDGVAYVGSSDGQLVVAVDASTGDERWRFDTGGSPWSQPAVTDAAVFIGTVGVADYMVAHSSDFFALDRATGKPLWHVPFERPGTAAHWGFGASPVVDDTMVFVGGLDGVVQAFRHRPAGESP